MLRYASLLSGTYRSVEFTDCSSMESPNFCGADAPIASQFAFNCEGRATDSILSAGGNCSPFLMTIDDRKVAAGRKSLQNPILST